MRLRGVGHLPESWFLGLRAEVDTVLAPQLPPAAGKPHPYVRCGEITRHAAGLPTARLRNPADPRGEAATACRNARSKTFYNNQKWRGSVVVNFQRICQSK